VEVTFREITLEELPAVKAMTEETWHYSFAEMLPGEQIEYMLSGLYSLERMREELRGGKVSYRFIYSGKDRVGFCAFGPTDRPGELKIHKLYVLPRYQGCGYGSQSLRRIEELWKERGGGSLVLLVNKKNAGAIALYRKHGFVVHRSLCTEIGGGFEMDDYLMVKSLH
jgi:ribosomal protein S18 acetylase RimI-like enzyme